MTKEKSWLRLRKVDLAWMAGFMDGEGSIGAYTRYYNVYVSITNTERWMLELFKFAFGGNVYDLLGGEVNWKARYEYKISGDKALVMLRALLPYLKLKKGQAELAVQYLEHRKRGHKSRPVTEAEFILRKSYADRINVMRKQKGGYGAQ